MGLVLDRPRPRDFLNISSLVDPGTAKGSEVGRGGGGRGQAELSLCKIIPATASRGLSFLCTPHFPPVEPSASTNSGEGGVGRWEAEKPGKPF